jgi:hypothetical protein
LTKTENFSRIRSQKGPLFQYVTYLFNIELTLISNAFWANQYDLTQHYLSYYKQIEQRISVKVIQQLMQAKPSWMVYANTAPPTLDWLSHLLLFPQYHHQLTTYILETISHVMLDFDSMSIPCNR